MNIEQAKQAKDLAAQKEGFLDFEDYQNITEGFGNDRRLRVLHNCMELCIEGERQRITEKVNKHFEIYVGCPIEVEDMAPGKAYAKGRTDAISELKKQLANK